MHSDHAQRQPDAASDAAPEGVSLPPQDALLDDAGTGEDGVELAPPRHRLPQIALPDNVVLKGAVQKLVEQKARLDRLAAEGQLAGLLPPEWQGHGLRAIDLSSFVQGVLPFLPDRRAWRDRAGPPACAPCAGRRQPLAPGGRGRTQIAGLVPRRG